MNLKKSNQQTKFYEERTLRFEPARVRCSILFLVTGTKREMEMSRGRCGSGFELGKWVSEVVAKGFTCPRSRGENCQGFTTEDKHVSTRGSITHRGGCASGEKRLRREREKARICEKRRTRENAGKCCFPIVPRITGIYP